MIKYICIKRFWYLQTFLAMMATMLKFMFIYNQFIMVDNKYFRKCICGVFAATLTRSNINIEFVYLCNRSKDFAPISTISDYIHWAALAEWFFVFHYIDEIMNVWRLITYLFCFIQYITLKYNYTQYQRFILNVFLYCVYCSYLYSNKITTIKSDTFSNLTNLKEL
jgi:hypothetical protein